MITTISTEEFKDLRQRDPQLRVLDVRTGGEFETIHIPGSYNVPLDTLPEHVTDLASVEHPVVLVCQSGQRAGTAHGHLTEAGKAELRILDGGMNAWQASGGDVNTGQQRWAMDRQVRLAAGSLVLAGMAASTVIPGAKWFAGAIGAGLTFSAVSNTCAMGTALSKLPYNQADNCDIAGALEAMGVR